MSSTRDGKGHLTAADKSTRARSQHSILAVADDLTGALEVGAKFAVHGLSAVVVTDLALARQTDCPVLVIDMETRHLTASEAAARTRELALKALCFSPCLVYQKTDSTLRGNIAAEMRALQEVFSCLTTVYAPAYPDMERTVKSGELFVSGRRLEETEFAKDRWNPIRDCRIEIILEGVAAQVVDGESNADMDAAVQGILAGPAPHLCAGPAGLAEALARRLQHQKPINFQRPKVSRCLVVNGSLHPVSISQMDLAARQGLFDDHWIRFEGQMEVVGLERAMQTGESVRRTLHSSPFDTLIVFGGDTAFGIHHSLGCGPFSSWGEIAPGVPVSESGGLLWITKAGGFGPPNILSIIRDRFT